METGKSKEVKKASPAIGGKSIVKANGMKSMLVVDDKLILTGFGKGNTAIAETQFENEAQTRITDPGTFTAENEPATILVSRGGYMTPGHATKVSLRDDILGMRSALEQRYFKQTFNDNIHIQIIYNILDIEKILAEFIDSIIFSVNNVAGAKEKEDFIGNYAPSRPAGLAGRVTTKKDFIENPRLRYFGTAFYNTGFDIKGKIEKTERRSDKEVVAILELLGGVRQFLKHYRKDFEDNSWLYLLDRDLPEFHKQLLDKLYEERVASLNKSFLENSGKELAVLLEALNINGDKETARYTQMYYSFVIKKESANLGFNLKQLREVLIDTNWTQLRDKDYDSVRSKIYKLFDFILFAEYVCKDEMREALVDRLRRTMNDDEKDTVYREEAQNRYQNVKKAFNTVLQRIGKGSKVKYIEKTVTQADADKWLQEVKLNAKDASYFTKLMYLLTMFLDGKEINNLLTALINKFDNIGSFNALLQEFKLPTFIPAKTAPNSPRTAGFFLNSAKIANELRVVKSLARMQKPLPSAKWDLYTDALCVLGLPAEKYNAYYERFIFDKNKGDKSGGVQNKQTSLRNFVCNNVISSSRFRYLIRFANPQLVCAFAKNKALVRFVLARLPETQIERYYLSCVTDRKGVSVENMLNALTDCVSNFSFEKNKVQEVKQNSKMVSDQKFKEQLTAIIGLYLTVLYQIVKNLVNINARYTIAIHCRERDTHLMCEKVDSNTPFAATEYFIAQKEKEHAARRAIVRVTQSGKTKTGKRINGHGLNMVKDNYARMLSYGEDGINAFGLYRNQIAHMDAISNAARYADRLQTVTSWFSLYHFSIQCYMADTFDGGDDMKALLNRTLQYGAYQKDTLWLLNVPFAYNLSRYKNLSVEDLFDKNEAQRQEETKTK